MLQWNILRQVPCANAVGYDYAYIEYYSFNLHCAN